jgi:hypothetical protein
VQAGLPGRHADRMHAAWEAEEYYQGRGAQFIEKRDAESPVDFQAKPKRTSNLTRKVVRVLSGQLWGNGPSRQVPGGARVEAWYQNVTAALAADARLLSADRAAILGHAAAIEIEPTGDPKRPARWYVWKPFEFAVWTRGDDPADVWAICTRSVIPEPGSPGKVRARFRVWSAAERRTFVSKPYAFGEPSAGKRADIFVPDESGASPYPGVLPFVFVRFEPAVCEFWEGGIGQPLVECNGELDRAMTDLAVHVREFLNPIGWARGIPATYRMFDKIGRFSHLRPDQATRSGDMRLNPELGFLQAQLGVDPAWFDLRSYVNQKLDELDVPAEIVRTVDSVSYSSGIEVVARRLPFYEQARVRQKPASETETELFAKTCAVVGTWVGQQASGDASAAELVAAAQDPGLVVTWPEPKIPLPTPERDAADQAELDMGLTDPIEVLARRRGVTLDQAAELAAQIAERRKQWNAIQAGIEEDAAPETPPGAAAATEVEEPGDDSTDEGTPMNGDPEDQGETA